MLAAQQRGSAALPSGIDADYYREMVSQIKLTPKVGIQAEA
jgi:hypothetical protein